jgi:hypothetical protein
MRRLRTILILRGCLAVLFLGLGVAALADGRTVFGSFAIAIGITNGVLVTVLERRRRGTVRP